MPIRKAFCAALTLFTLSVGSLTGLVDHASAQPKNPIFGNQIPIAKLDQIGKWKKGFVAQERHYTYVVEVPCNSGPAQFVYTLRGDTGIYLENWCPTYLNGTLTYLNNDPVTIQGITVNGFRYNGTDESGDWSYFFGSDDLTGQNEYVVAYALGHYQTGVDPQFNGVYLAKRSQP